VAEDEETPQQPEEPTASEQDVPQAPEETPEAEADEATEVAAAPVEDDAPAAAEPVAEAEEPAEAEAPAEEPVADEVAASAPQAGVEAEGETAETAEAPAAAEAAEDEDEDEEPATPRVRPEIPGADLEVDIVREGEDPLAHLTDEEREEAEAALAAEEEADQPIAEAAIDLAAGASYKATGKRKTAIARVTLKPGDGTYTINGKPLDAYFPRATLQRTIRQPLETVGYEDRMDVIARMDGGGVSAQAGALRHGISRALLEADPNLRGELKRRGFLTRDARAKERKKAGLKKARKRPQFSKR
jgi:small subunit ribosomal protein S9